MSYYLKKITLNIFQESKQNGVLTNMYFASRKNYSIETTSLSLFDFHPFLYLYLNHTECFVPVQLVAKVTAFPAMASSNTTSMTSYTGYVPAAKVPGSPTGSLGGCTSPDSTNMHVLSNNGFEASLYDEFLSTGSKRSYQYITNQQLNQQTQQQPTQFLPHHMQQHQQQPSRQPPQHGQLPRTYITCSNGVVMTKREDDYSRPGYILFLLILFILLHFINLLGRNHL